jgi:hypothetical protein
VRTKRDRQRRRNNEGREKQNLSEPQPYLIRTEELALDAGAAAARRGSQHPPPLLVLLSGWWAKAGS